MLPAMARLSIFLLGLALLGACSDENDGESDVCSTENVVDDVDDGTGASGDTTSAY